MTQDRQERDRQAHDRPEDEHERGEILLRVGALVGAAAALLLAARRKSASAWTGATAVALPLASRGITGRWPLEETLTGSDAVDVRATFTIMGSSVEIYDRWRRLEELPTVLRHVKEVREMENGRSFWRAETPAGEVEWEAEIVEEERPEVLHWQSLPGSEVDHGGELRLKALRGGQGTQVELRIRIGRGSHPGPMGSGGTFQGVRKAVAALVRPALELEVKEDLRRFKNLVEAGEIPTTEGQPSGERKALELSNPF